MNATTNGHLDPCGCCKAHPPQPTIHNRPGLSALVYRVGTHSTFLRRMLAGLPVETIPDGLNNGIRPLRALTTRATTDPSIAMLDAWATVADVLSFYQERIANEGFLRTATERRSLLELARMIGYELDPGVAASAFLAFTVEDAPGAPGVAVVPMGTKVQSIPGQGKLPQTFEASDTVTTRAEWNDLRPRLSRPQDLAIGTDPPDNREKLLLLDLSTGFGSDRRELDADDLYPIDPDTTLPRGAVGVIAVRQIFVAGTNTNLKPGDLLLLVGKKSGDDGETTKVLVREIERVEIEPGLNRTRLDFLDETTQESPKLPTFMPIFLRPATIKLTTIKLDKTGVDSLILAETWRERDLTAFLSIQSWSRRNAIRYINRPPSPKLPPADAGAFGFRLLAGPFGHNAPRWDSLPLNQRYPDQNAGKPVPYPEPGWDGANEPNITTTSKSGETYLAKFSVDFFAERILPEVTKGSWLILESPTHREPYRVSVRKDVSLADFSLNAKATGFQVESQPDSAALTVFKLRTTSIHAASQPLELARLPIDQPVAEGDTSLQLDGMVLGLRVGQPLSLSGERDDLPGVKSTEIVLLSDILHSGGFTTLVFEDGLLNSYVRETVTINANVVRATHGETTVEILGSGNGTEANQRLAIKKPPLTYVSAATLSGAQSTMQVRVNGVQWAEAPRLFGLDARSESYIVRIEDDGKTRVIFGDGTMGARLPTGAENVVAAYRSGIGLPGMVPANALTLLQTRPLGIRSVTNPLPASGAEEPENRDSARDNAPLTVLTLDRIVSLRDFEDFARAFAGIGKAQAIAFWKRETRLVHITIASAAPVGGAEDEDGGPALVTNVVDPTSPLFTNLVDAIQGARDPAQSFEVASYRPLFFNVKAKVLVNPCYRQETVFAAVETALNDAFSFGERGFGQPVTAAEVVTVIQNVQGVIATDLDQLYRYEEDQAPPDPGAQITPDLLDANHAYWDEVLNQVVPAELLLINPVGIALEEMQR